MPDILFEYLRNQVELIIYGAGGNGKFLKWVFDKNLIKIHFFCDSNDDLWGKSLDGVECIPPEKLVEHTNAVVIISPCKNNEIKVMLQQYHFKKILEWDDVSFLKNRSDTKTHLILKNELANDLKLQGILEQNKRFKNIYQGKRCFVIGNGPSLLKEDLSVLANEITFTVNQIARSQQFEEIHTNYHLWADPYFFKTELKTEGDYVLLDLIKKLPSTAECFFRYDCMHEYVEKYELNKYINVNYYAVSSLIEEQEEIDFSWFIRGAHTVVQYAVRLAIYMGFKEIYLLGCDCTAIMNTINTRLSSHTFQAHCYDIDERERERERKICEEVSLQRYYKAEIELLNGYKSLRQYCMVRGIDIYNCTQGGLLDEFPRRNLKEVFKDK